MTPCTYAKPTIEYEVKLVSHFVDGIYRQSQNENNYEYLYEYISDKSLSFFIVNWTNDEMTYECDGQTIKLDNSQKFVLYGDEHSYREDYEITDYYICYQLFVDDKVVYEKKEEKTPASSETTSSNKTYYSGSSSSSDYNKEDYYDVDDFYDDTYGDFEDYEEAEDYYYDYVE